MEKSYQAIKQAVGNKMRDMTLILNSRAAPENFKDLFMRYNPQKLYEDILRAIDEIQ